MNDQLPDPTITNCERVLHDLTRSLEGQLLISQDRCVDGLLDVYNSAPSDAIRDLATTAMADIQHLSAVRANDMAAALAQIGTALAVDAAFDSTEIDLGDDALVNGIEGAVADV
jgi:hypothetical protein